MKKEDLNITVALTSLTIFSFPLIVLSSLKKNKNIVFFITIFSFVMGYFFIPIYEEYDIYRHYETYKKIIFYEDINKYYTKDYYIRILILILKSLNLKENFIGGISCSILYHSLAKCFLIASNNFKNLKSKESLFWLIISILSVPFIFYTGIRYSTAVSFYILGITKYIYEKNKAMFVLFMALSILSHFGILPIIVITLFYIINKKLFSIKVLKIIVLAFFIVGKFNILLFIVKIIEMINLYGIVHFNIDGYIIGDWGINYGLQMNSTGQTVFLLRKILSQIIMLYYSMLSFRLNSIKLKKIILILISYSFLVQSFFIPFERVERIIFILIIISLIGKNNSIFKEKKRCLFIGLIIIVTFTNQLFDIKSNYMSYFISYGNFMKVSLIRIFYDILN